jgi:hypothetical protein
MVVAGLVMVLECVRRLVFERWTRLALAWITSSHNRIHRPTAVLKEAYLWEYGAARW